MEQTPKPTGITSQPSNDPSWSTPKPTPNVGGSSTPLTLILTAIGLCGLCVLGALVGSWVLVLCGLVAALLVFHYCVWGWFATRLVTEQQKQELLRLAEQDERYLPDPQRSRHI